MESLRWPRLESPDRTGTQRLRPVVRRRTRPTARPAPSRRTVAAGAALVALAGIALWAARPGAPDAPEPTLQALAAVAPDVAGRPWLARRGEDEWVWGRAGSRARGVLPADETGYAIADRWLASGLSGPGATRVRVRDLQSGEVLFERQLDLRVSSAAFAGSRLLLTGYAGDGAAADGGVVSIDVPGGVVRTLVAAGPFPDRLGGSPSKGDFHVSASGSVAAVNACGTLGCDTIVVDLGTLTASTPQQGTPGFLRAVTDDLLVLTDGDGRWIKGIDGGTGANRFTIPDVSLMEPASMADGRVIANVGGGARGWQVAAFGGDGRLAPITDPANAPGPWVWPAVSSPTVAVLADVRFEEALGPGVDRKSTLVRASDLRQVGTLVVQPAESGAR